MNKVEVVRYIRPDNKVWVLDKYEENSNLYGVTVVFDVDYDSQTVVAKWSVCNGDNFEKTLGKQIAKSSKLAFTFPMSTVKEKEGIVAALLFELCCALDPVNLENYKDVNFNTGKKDRFDTVMKIFLTANRELKT